MLFVSNFLTRNIFFNYFLTVRTPVCFLPKKIMLYFHTHLVTTVLHCFVTKEMKRQRQRAITATIACSQDSQCKITMCVTSLSKTGASNRNISRTN